MNDRQTNIERQTKQLESKFMDEVNRILNSGMVNDTTSTAGIIRVALENIANGYTRSHDHKNLSRI